MLKKLLLPGLLAATSVFAADNPPKITAADALSLRVSFDNGTTAEVAAGRKTACEARGKVAYADGINGGKALISGVNGATMIYEFKNNVDFDQPGTMMMWFKANTDWHKNPPPFMVYFGWGNNKGLLHVRVSRNPAKACICRRPMEVWLYHYPNRRNATLVMQAPALTKLCQGWHLVAMAWDKDQLFLSYDGMPFRAYKLEKPFSNADFAHSPRFAVGQAVSEFLIDEFRVYKKKLSDDELQEVWELGNGF